VIELDALTTAAEALDPLPVSVTRLATLVCRDAPEVDDVVDVVRYDQALTAAVLGTANSSWSASRTRITTVRDAVVRLGTGPVLSIALGATVRARFSRAVPEYGLDEGELWEHSVAASLAAELVTRRATNRPPAEAATAALLHDVGKLVMARYLDRELLRVLHLAAEEGVNRRTAEFEVLGVDHAELGALIAQTWRLPPSLVRGIGYHHDPVLGGDVICHAVHLADVIAKIVGLGVEDNPDLETYATAVHTLGLRPDDVDDICRLVEARYREVRDRFV
jgi:putative nucleotidyltransferase with HDIG domain